MGCWTDTSTRAIPTLEGSDDILDGNYEDRTNATEKCKRAVLNRGKFYKNKCTIINYLNPLDTIGYIMFNEPIYYSIKYFTGWSVFAIQNGGWCASSATAFDTYQMYGESEECGADGEGGLSANHVYQIVPSEYIRSFFVEQITSRFF